MIEQCTYEQFCKDVSQHTMTIEQDDGVFRCLHFAKPDNSNQHFRITTWPGHLCFSGDMGTFVFSRSRDMFEFFDSKPGKINPGYWSEKVQAQSIFGGGMRQFKLELYVKDVEEWITEYTPEWAERLPSGYTIEEIVAGVRESLLERVEDEPSAIEAVRDFSPHDNGIAVDFEPSWNSYYRFTYYYIWACYAINWAVGQYEAHKQAQ